jgi:hypothetical protein
MNITNDVAPFLDDPKLFALFAQNCAIKHPKLIPIPIGLRSECLFKLLATQQQALIRNLMRHMPHPKKHVLYVNFCIGTNAHVRQAVYDDIKDYPFCTIEKRKPMAEYLEDVAMAEFVISPHGSGLDCYRTWEALCLGSYPIVKTSSLDSLYEGLPVLIINNWQELSVHMLEEARAAFEKQSFAWERLDFAYWKKLVLQTQQACRAKSIR